MKGHAPWQLNEEKFWSCLKQPQRERRWDTNLLSTTPLLSHTSGPHGVAGALCPYETRVLAVPQGAGSGCSLLCSEELLQLRSRGGTALLRRITERAAARARCIPYTCYTQRVHNFFSINSDSFHTLTFRPSPRAQIRIMVLGAWWDARFQQLPLFFIFQLNKHKHQLLKRVLVVLISSRQNGYPFCLKIWAFYTFDQASKISTQSAWSLKQITYLINPNSEAVTTVVPSDNNGRVKSFPKIAE